MGLPNDSTSSYQQNPQELPDIFNAQFSDRRGAKFAEETITLGKEITTSRRGEER